jgi:hypothetical protein
MNCSVEGCNTEATNNPGGKTGINLCKAHWNDWGYFQVGYECGYFKDTKIEGHDGRTTRGLWDKAMSAFLDWCRIEIEACIEIAEAQGRVLAANRHP